MMEYVSAVRHRALRFFSEDEIAGRSDHQWYREGEVQELVKAVEGMEWNKGHIARPLQSWWHTDKGFEEKVINTLEKVLCLTPSHSLHSEKTTE